ncbi:MAG: hypothetical protein GF383_00015 [Candidatus Lokiarchaeota archaeon]|nr:hypothetical protein [Candidatus Lokiarchaeota archaeon]MBD3337459.1 hypothetical protein [Candidatus Lokiarchaeota archaeon]
MSAQDNENLPKSPIEAQGMLIKAFYNQFGKKALPIIKEICRKQGKSLGLRIKKKLIDNNLPLVAKAFSKSFDQNFVKIVNLTDTCFRIQGTRCPFGLENTSRELCEAVMEIDHEYFRTAMSEEITLEIVKTVAEGDSRCDTVYKLKTE